MLRHGGGAIELLHVPGGTGKERDRGPGCGEGGERAAVGVRGEEDRQHDHRHRRRRQAPFVAAQPGRQHHRREEREVRHGGEPGA